MFLIAMLIAITMETLVLLVASKCLKFKARPLPILLLAGSIPSIASLPWIWYIMPEFFEMRTLNIIIAEIIVVFCEALLIRLITTYKYNQSLILAFVMNLISYIIGRLLF